MKRNLVSISIAVFFLPVILLSVSGGVSDSTPAELRNDLLQTKQEIPSSGWEIRVVNASDLLSAKGLLQRTLMTDSALERQMSDQFRQNTKEFSTLVHDAVNSGAASVLQYKDEYADGVYVEAALWDFQTEEKARKFMSVSARLATEAMNYFELKSSEQKKMLDKGHAEQAEKWPGRVDGSWYQDSQEERAELYPNEYELTSAGLGDESLVFRQLWTAAYFQTIITDKKYISHTEIGGAAGVQRFGEYIRKGSRVLVIWSINSRYPTQKVVTDEREGTRRILYETEIVPAPPYPQGDVESIVSAAYRKMARNSSVSDRRNTPPAISLSMNNQSPKPGDKVVVKALVSDPDSDPLTITWFVNGVKKAFTGNELILAGLASGKFTVEATVSDGQESGSDKMTFQVKSDNQPPSVQLTYAPDNPIEGDRITVTAHATDPDNDALTFKWWMYGTLQGSTGPELVSTNLPAGTVQIKCEVDDGKGGKAEDQKNITVLPGIPSDFICSNPFVSDAAPRIGDTIKISADIRNPGTQGADCTVNLKVTSQGRAVFQAQSTHYVPAQREKRVSFSVPIQGTWAGILKIQIGSCAGLQVEIQPMKSGIKGTVKEVGILDNIPRATVTATRIEPPDGLTRTVSAGDGQYTLELKQGVYTVFAVAPGYIKSFGLVECGKRVEVKPDQYTTLIDFRLVPQRIPR